MRYNKIRKMDVSNGPGVRVTLFTQGCDFHCKGCFNSVAWDYSGGKLFTKEEMNKLIELSKDKHIAGLSILGGEPMSEVNLMDLATLTYKFKLKYPNKTIWIWTGYLLEDLLKKYKDNSYFKEILNNIDILVDGLFIEKLKDPSLKYCGSSNQRVINVKKTLRKNKIILYKEKEYKINE